MAHDEHGNASDAPKKRGAFGAGGGADDSTAGGPAREESGLSLGEKLAAGAVFGHYTVEGVLGHGGMGVLYRARQERPAREVALKVIRSGLASSQSLRRFELEAEVLGRLQHPGIAQVYEAGTSESGQPFFAMELVRGETLTRYAAANQLNTRKRMELFAKVCDAVQHAHTKGVIHRDLKPGNILVNAEGQPKILDFGVARLTQRDVHAITVETDVGQLIGTVPYMSPEQVEGDPANLDTRSDVYALGVIFYELLTGRMPYDLSEKMIHEAARIIREDEPTRLSSINRTLRGDIETIALKALEKDKNRRYQAASDLGSDISRYLRDEPIVARPASRGYQLKKFVQRNKALVGGLAAVFVAVTAGLVGTSYGLMQARAQRSIAESHAAAAQLEAARATAISEFVTSSLGTSDPNRGGAQDMTVAEAMMRALEKLGSGELQTQPETAAALLRTISAILDGNGRSAEAEAPAERGLALARQAHPGDDAAVARSLINLATVRAKLGRLADAETLFSEALEMRRRLFPGDHADVAAALSGLAVTRKNLGRVAQADELFVEALEMCRRLFAGDHPDLALAIANLGFVREALGRAEEAQELHIEALAMRRRLFPGDDPHVTSSIMHLASVRQDLGQDEEAEALYGEALAMSRRMFKGNHPDVALALNNLASARTSLGRIAEAEPLFAEALAMYRQLAPGDNPDVASSLNNLAAVRNVLGRTSEAELLFVEMLEMYGRMFTGDHPDVASALNNLGVVRETLGRAVEAESLHLQALAMRQRLYPGDHPLVALSVLNLASARQMLGGANEARQGFDEAIAMQRRLSAEGSAALARALWKSGKARLDGGDAVGALAELDEALAMGERYLPEGHPHLVEYGEGVEECVAAKGR